MALKSIRQSIFGLIVQIRRGSVCYIGGSDLLPPPLSREEELALMRRCNAGDTGARATLIERNLRLVVYISRKFENTGISIEDLISIGAIGLIKAVNSFDPDKNIKLATYASRCIENEILMVLRKSNRLKSEVSFDEPAGTVVLPLLTDHQEGDAGLQGQCGGQGDGSEDHACDPRGLHALLLHHGRHGLGDERQDRGLGAGLLDVYVVVALVSGGEGELPELKRSAVFQCFLQIAHVITRAPS